MTGKSKPQVKGKTMSTIQQMKDLVGRWHRRGDPDCADELALLVEKLEKEVDAQRGSYRADAAESPVKDQTQEPGQETKR